MYEVCYIFHICLISLEVDGPISVDRMHKMADKQEMILAQVLAFTNINIKIIYHHHTASLIAITNIVIVYITFYDAVPVRASYQLSPIQSSSHSAIHRAGRFHPSTIRGQQEARHTMAYLYLYQ